MIDNLLKKLAGYIVAALFDWLGVKDADELIAKVTAAAKAELADDLSKLDDIPGQVETVITRQVSGIITQMQSLPGQMLSQLPDFSVIINNAIRQFNPFAR